MIFLSFLGLIPRVLLGFCIIQTLWDTFEKKHLLIKLFLAGVIGFGVSSLLSFLWIWLGLSMFIYAILESIFALLFAIWVVYKNRNQIFSAQWSFSIDRSNTIWLILLIAGALLYIFGLITTYLEYPHGRMDAWTNWNVAARIIYLGGSDWQNTFQRQLDHADYPLFMSMSNTLTWTMMGKDSTWGPAMYHFFISLFTAGLLFALVNASRNFKQASLAVILFMAQPFTAGNSLSQLADFPLSYMILAMGGLTLLYFQIKEKRIAVLIGFLAGLAAWTKNEGVVVAVICTAGWGLIALLNDRPAFKNYLFGLALPLIVVILFKVFLAPPSDLFSTPGKESLFEKITDIGRYITIFKIGGSSLWNLGGGAISVTGILLAYMLVVGKAQENIPGLWIIGSMVIIQLLVYFAIYIITPHDLIWHLETSVGRLYSHVFPLALLWLFNWTASPQELYLSMKEK